MQKFAVFRMIGLLIALAGIASGIYFAIEARRTYVGYYEWMDARPFEMKVDFSNPGRVDAPFVQTCQTAHSEDVFFECSELTDQELQNVAVVFSGLQAGMWIEDKNGDVVERVALDSRTIRYEYGKVVLASFYPFDLGDYRVFLEVESGAEALAGKAQKVYAKYMLCGLEIMPAYLSGVVALAAMLVGLVSAVGSVPGLLRYGLKRPLCDQAPEFDQ